MTNNKTVPKDAPRNGIYQHYKGNKYQVFGMAQHSETDEWMVVYQALYGDFGFWLRPLSIWLEPVSAISNELTLDVASDVASKLPSRAQKERFELVTPTEVSLTQLTKF